MPNVSGALCSLGYSRGPPLNPLPCPRITLFRQPLSLPLYPDKPLKLTALWSSSPRFVRFRATDQFPFFVLTDRFDTPFVSLPSLSPLRQGGREAGARNLRFITPAAVTADDRDRPQIDSCTVNRPSLDRCCRDRSAKRGRVQCQDHQSKTSFHRRRRRSQ